MNEDTLLTWFANTNFELMELTDPYFFTSLLAIVFFGAFIKMTPLKYDVNHHKFSDVILIYIRRLILWVTGLLLFLPLVMFFIFDLTSNSPSETNLNQFKNWFFSLVSFYAWMFPVSLISAWSLRFLKGRYLIPILSKIYRSLRFKQSDDELSNIVDELDKYKAKTFDPTKYYDLKDKVFLALDDKDEPIYVPRSTYVEVNMQIVGPTRYFKGVEAGVLVDQGISFGDSIFYIAPKKEKFLPHIMYEAAKKNNRKFYYLDLTDNGPGKWGPFLGGSLRSAISRLYLAVGLEYTGQSGTDFYKSAERKQLINAFLNGRSLKSILQNTDESEALKIHSTISEWTTFDTYNCKQNQGFSIEKAIKENAVVYVQGDLTDPVVKLMQKIFIVELVQEASRLEPVRESHLTIVVDEVRFLVSQQLAEALATIVGFDVNIITMYQSITDLTAPDDVNVNGKALLNSVNVNSQLKAIYGGADSETAEWISELSGEKTINISKFEKTDIVDGGGEVWEGGRMIGTEKVALIDSNVVKILPPGVCALFQPRATAQIAFTSWVNISKEKPLLDYLKTLDKKRVSIEAHREKVATKKVEDKEKMETVIGENLVELEQLLTTSQNNDGGIQTAEKSKKRAGRKKKQNQNKKESKKEAKEHLKSKSPPTTTPEIEPFSLDFNEDDNSLLASLNEEE